MELKLRLLHGRQGAWWGRAKRPISPFQARRTLDFLDQPASGALGRDAVSLRKVTVFQLFFTGWNGLMRWRRRRRGEQETCASEKISRRRWAGQREV
jgi:hypothetical protein